MRRLSFSRLLLLIAFVPAVALALFAGSMTYESWTRYNALTRADSLLRLAVAAGRFGLEGLPGEGASTRDYLAGGDKSKLADARAKTDKFYRELQAAPVENAVADPTIDGYMKAITERMQQFPGFRAKVDEKTAQAADVAAVLPPITARVYNLIGRAGAIAGNAELSRRILALFSTLQFADGVFMQRGFIQRSLQEGQLPTAQLLLFAKGYDLKREVAKFLDTVRAA